jgi:hypothetical protein
MPVWFVALLLCSPAWADPGQLHPHATLDLVEDRLEELEHAPAPTCPRGRLCVTAGSANTHIVQPELASMKPTLPGGAPAFARSLELVSRATGSAMRDESPWTFVLSSGRAVRPGSLVCLVFDAHDARAIAARQVVALYQTDVRGTAVALKLRLSPDDGFAANHSYLIRLIQLVGGRELRIAETELTLL